MTPTQVAHRGYNLMAAAFLFFIGLGMGSNAIPEANFPDKIDDLALLTIGLITVLWYLTIGRTRRSIAPVVLTALALAAQVLGVVLEVSDKDAFGDNIGGMVILVPFLLFMIWQYARQARVIDVVIPAGPAGLERQAARR
jgi:hypothetical protein